ncbi:LamG domain-containing protein [Candidatus Poribacteria bacterium]|nr:LamG domain-containing protein [Candidatus Poribacteria bacterium]
MKTFTRLSIVFFCLGIAISGNAKIDEETILGIWLIDEDIDKTVKDASGNGHDGQVFGKPKVVDGKFGKALSFSGAGDKIEIPHDDVFTTPTFTLMAWVNVEDLATGWRMIVGKDAWPDRNYAMFVHRDNGQLHCAFGTPALQDRGNFNSKGLIVDGTWHHVAFTYDKKVRRAYVDGDLDTEVPLDIDPGTPQVPAIISRPPFKGLIDEVYIGNAAVEPEDVKTAAEKGLVETLKIARDIAPQGKLAVRWGAIKDIPHNISETNHP